MRPERIIVGEVRGPEAFDLLQAMNTGHDGSMGTLHANSPREALSRPESMIMMGGFTSASVMIRDDRRLDRHCHTGVPFTRRLAVTW
jgi:pilus assembly protein CpaF